MRRIAVDAMGGDHAPIPEIAGSLAAARHHGVAVTLVGDKERLEAELARHDPRPPLLTVHHASQVITMHDAPAAAVKSKKDASMRVCFELVKRGEAAAVVSAGHSGAMLACGLLVLRRIKGVDRPGIITLCPTRGGGQCVVLDVGANTEVRPMTLAQYGVMGAAYARTLLGVARPRVAILANGEEESKGTALTRDAYHLLSNETVPRDFEFIGYLEGRDLFTGLADVIVTDGFTGNVALKTTEGVTRFIVDLLRSEAARSPLVRMGALLMKPAFNRLKERLSEDEYGGAPLLGIDGVAIVCHGNSSARAIENGIRTAARFVDARLAPAVGDAITRHRALWQGDGGGTGDHNPEPDTERSASGPATEMDG
ncbi:MAG TPA: phosphate acyltransferase PlsX [Polyangia bacterium]|jgi:glycerol-3-phosphate acyltransferase PlsX|nr:phosphate acyltransferase PlsX [Polyangia bacterium]